MLKFGYILVIALIATNEAARTITNHLSSGDLDRLNKVFADAIKLNDLQSIYYSAANLKQLSSEEKQATCGRLVQLHTDSKLNEFEKNFYLTGAHKLLACSSPIPATVVSTVKATLSKDTTTAQGLYFNYFSTVNVGGVIDDATKARVAKNLQTILKADDSLSSLGYAFHVAAELGKHGASIADWIESAFAQADEVDGKLLQFEGGLSITSLIINGAFKLSSTLNKPLPLTEDQASKFVAYFLTRRSVQQAKGAAVLLESLGTIANDRKLAPVCIQVIGNGQIQPESPALNVKIVDILGRPLSPAIASVTATVTAKSDNTVLVNKVALTSKSSDKTVYALDLKASKPVRGLYTADVTADAYKQTVTVKVLGKVKVQTLEIGVGEADSTSAVKKQSVAFPNKISGPLAADHQQKIHLRTVLVDELNNKPVTVHQAFVLLEHKESKEEIVFVAEQDLSKAYKFDLDVGARGVDFGQRSGLYSLHLIVGDASLSNSFKWHVADFDLKFSSESARVSRDSNNTRAPRPEIIHQFREPEKRPSRVVSDVFTGLCVAPLLILFLLWIKLGVNVSNFPISLSALGFHLGFGGILGLFGIFWLQLNMFETLRLLVPLGLITFFFGNRLLRAIASRKSIESK